MAKRREFRTDRKGKCTTTTQQRQPPINGQALRAAVGWVAQARVFEDFKKHGNTSWTAADLILLAVVWVWSESTTLTGAFHEAHHWSLKVLGRAAVGTYQGLLKALVTWTPRWLPVIGQRLHDLMRQHGGRHWRVGRWMPLAVDGSRVSVPRTKDNEKAFCAPHYGKGVTAKYRKKKTKEKRVRRKAKEKMQPVKPQIWITLLWHMGLQMPWTWRSGPSHSSERDHFGQMLREENFPENTLFCGDAGFTGYDLWKTIVDDGHHLLIRVGANVTLLRKLGYVRERKGLVYCWPNAAARKRQPPLVLRLMHLKLGRCPIHLVTSVLDARQLSDHEAIELYRRRWGVELQFRALKQTFTRRKLRCRQPDRALVELDWSLVGLWMIQLFAVKEQIAIGEVPAHCSVSLAIEVVRRTFRRWSERPDPEGGFTFELRLAVHDSYHRTTSKQARYRPNYKDKPAAGRPNLVTATRKHKSQLRMQLNMAA